MKRLKMRDLEKATGIGRETIRFYIREGLLPEPERPRRNVAWYDESFVQRIGLIKELKQKRFLPLHVIKTIVGADTPPSRDEVRTLLELDGKLFPAVGGAAPQPERLSAVASRTGLGARNILRFAEVGLFEVETRDGDRWLDETAVRIVEVLARMQAAGFTDARGFGPDKYRLYVDFVQWLAREELRQFTQGVTGRIPTSEVAHMAEEGITHVNQLLALMRKATLLRFISEANAPPASSEGEAAGAARTSG
jgi:DNA-binding transcriptional MerR regulator